VTETRVGVVAVAVTAGERDTAFAPGEGPAEPGGWEATEVAGQRRLSYRLGELGLAGPDDRPTTAGAALVAVLRAGGKLDRPANDPAMLTLGGVLSRFLQIDGPPFTFESSPGAWVARFEAASLVRPSGR
jgi:hypothetical protein